MMKKGEIVCSLFKWSLQFKVCCKMVVSDELGD